MIRLVPGDYVVHIEHGIAQFGGVTSINGSQKEYLLLVYDDGRLYVPTDQIHQVKPYKGGKPVVDQLDAKPWPSLFGKRNLVEETSG